MQKERELQEGKDRVKELEGQISKLTYENDGLYSRIKDLEYTVDSLARYSIP